MPTFQLTTNVPLAKIPQDFNRELSELLAKLLEKELKFFCVYVNPGQLVTFGGTNEPCGFATLRSIGALGGELNQQHTKALFEFIQQKLGISGERLGIFYHDIPPADVGYNGRTFAGIR